MIRRQFSQLKNDYAIMTVSLLQRNPLIMRPLSPLQLEYSKYRQNLEIEKSRGTFQISQESGKSSTVPVAEIELLKKLTVKTEEEGKEGNFKDLGRKLYRILYLCLKDGESGKWTLPMNCFDPDNFNNDSALHLEAHKNLSEILAPSENLQLYHLGSAPVAFHLEKFTDRRSAPFGSKHFFFRSQLVAGRVKIDPGRFTDYGWFCREELEEKLGTDMFQSIKPVISE